MMGEKHVNRVGSILERCLPFGSVPLHYRTAVAAEFHALLEESDSDKTWIDAAVAKCAKRNCASYETALRDLREEVRALTIGKETALEWNRLAWKQRDKLQAKLDEAENIARMNGAERDALKADNERLRGEKWDGHLGGGRTRSGEK